MSWIFAFENKIEKIWILEIDQLEELLHWRLLVYSLPNSLNQSHFLSCVLSSLGKYDNSWHKIQYSSVILQSNDQSSTSPSTCDNCWTLWNIPVYCHHGQFDLLHSPQVGIFCVLWQNEYAFRWNYPLDNENGILRIGRFICSGSNPLEGLWQRHTFTETHMIYQSIYRFTKNNIYWVWFPFMSSLVVPKLPINETVDFWEGKNRCIKIKALKSYLKDWAESIASFVHCSYRLYPLYSLHENLSKKWPEWTGSRLVNLDGKDCFSNAVFLSSYQHHCGGQKRREGLEFLLLNIT